LHDHDGLAPPPAAPPHRSHRQGSWKEVAGFRKLVDFSPAAANSSKRTRSVLQCEKRRPGCKQLDRQGSQLPQGGVQARSIFVGADAGNSWFMIVLPAKCDNNASTFVDLEPSAAAKIRSRADRAFSRPCDQRYGALNRAAGIVSVFNLRTRIHAATQKSCFRAA